MTGSRSKFFWTVAIGWAKLASPTPEKFPASALQAPIPKGLANHHPLHAACSCSVIATRCVYSNAAGPNFGPVFSGPPTWRKPLSELDNILLACSANLPLSTSGLTALGAVRSLSRLRGIRRLFVWNVLGSIAHKSESDDDEKEDTD